MIQRTLVPILASVLAVYGWTNPMQAQQDSRGTPEDARTVEGRFKDVPDAAPGPVDAFGFEISVEPWREHQYLMQWQTILLTVQATRMVPSETGTLTVEVSVSSQPGLIRPFPK
jgi:hypothetical protein